MDENSSLKSFNSEIDKLLVNRRAKKHFHHLPNIVPKLQFNRKNREQFCPVKRKKYDRVVFKTGDFNIEKPNKSFFRCINLVSSFIEAQWRWTLVCCILTYIMVWLTFAGIWWIIMFLHEDLEEDHMPPFKNTTNWIPCVEEIYGFTSMFLFSIEIHTTIGYGTRSITLECPEAIFTMCIQGILGTIMQSFMVGLVFAKLTRPKCRRQTLLFTNNAVINKRDDNLCLIFRVGDVRKSRIIGVSIHAFLIRFQTKPGEIIKNEQIKLDLMTDTCEDIIFARPVSVIHRIDNNSPFYYSTAADMMSSRFEIVVVLEGTIESTGQAVQARSSYTAKEILWGHRFQPMVSYRYDRLGFEIDFSKFNETIRVDTPLFSAQILSLYSGGNFERVSAKRLCNSSKVLDGLNLFY